MSEEKEEMLTISQAAKTLKMNRAYLREYCSRWKLGRTEVINGHNTRLLSPIDIERIENRQKPGYPLSRRKTRDTSIETTP